MGRLIRFAVVAVWVALVATLVWENLPAGSRSTSAPVLAPDATSVARDEWTGVYHADRKIGYGHLRIRPRAGGYRFEEESLFRLTVLDTAQTVRTSIRADTGPDFALKKIRFDLVSNGVAFRAEGEADDRVLRVRSRVGDESSATEIPLDGPIYLPAGMRQRFAGTLAPGRQIEAAVFDPAAMSTLGVAMTVLNKERVPGFVPARNGWRVEQQYGGLKLIAWLDEDGRVLREEGPLGLVLMREEREQAIGGSWQDGTALDLVASAAIPLDQPLAAPASLRRMQLRIGGIDLEQVPADARQALSGDILTVEREDVPAAASYRLPNSDPAFAKDLAPSPLLESDHPRVRARAAEILGQERDPIRAVELLHRYVYDRLEKVPTVNVPSALHVLDTQKGDCNEHAALFVALARAAGIPARVVAGVVYLEDAFYYHAWGEVWLDRWVSVDSALGQLPADVTHIKFVAGGPEDHIAMMGVIGRLSLRQVAASG